MVICHHYILILILKNKAFLYSFRELFCVENNTGDYELLLPKSCFDSILKNLFEVSNASSSGNNRNSLRGVWFNCFLFLFSLKTENERKNTFDFVYSFSNPENRFNI